MKQTIGTRDYENLRKLELYEKIKVLLEIQYKDGVNHGLEPTEKREQRFSYVKWLERRRFQSIQKLIEKYFKVIVK